jgi:acetyl esterase/lipase
MKRRVPRLCSALLSVAAVCAGLTNLAATAPVVAQQPQTVRKPIGPSIIDHRPIEPVRDVVYAAPDRLELRADIYRPLDGAGPFPAVLTVHGGSWRNGNKTRVAAISTRLARAGYMAVAIDYRLAPRFRFPAQLEDCKAAVRWMRGNAERLAIDADRIGAWGYSAGGNLVALLAVTDLSARLEGYSGVPGAPNARLRAAVAGAPPTDFGEMPLDSVAYEYWLGGTRRQVPQVYELASPVRYVSRDDPPMFFYHGSDDSLVPIRNSETMVALLRRVGVTAELYAIEGAVHIDAGLNPDAARAAVQFLDQYLKAPPAVAR